MKSLKIIGLFVAVCAFMSFQTAEAIVGKWEIFKMENGEGEVIESKDRWMEFIADGTLKGGNTADTTNRTGFWQYNQKTKELTIGSEKKLPGEGTFGVNWIDKNTISIAIGKDRRVFLKRIK